MTRNIFRSDLQDRHRQEISVRDAELDSFVVKLGTYSICLSLALSRRMIAMTWRLKMTKNICHEILKDRQRQENPARDAGRNSFVVKLETYSICLSLAL